MRLTDLCCPCRIYQRSYLKMLHLTTLLVLFAAAAFKSDHTALLAATLVSEAHTVFFLSRRLQVPAPDGFDNCFETAVLLCLSPSSSAVAHRQHVSKVDR